MATGSSPSADQTSELLQNLSLDSQAQATEIPETNKTDVYQYGGVDSHGQAPSYNQSLTPMHSGDAVDPSVSYAPNPYQPVFGRGSQQYTGYPEAVGMNTGTYREHGSVVYPQGYGYATRPVPQVGSDGQLSGYQQYQYPNYFPSGPYPSSVGGVKTRPAESSNVVSAAGMARGDYGSSNLYGNGASGGGFAAGYQGPRYSYDGYHGPVYVSKYSDVQRPFSGSVAPSYSKANSVSSVRNQNYPSNSQHTHASMAGYGTAQGFQNRPYPSKSYPPQYGSTGGYGSSGYDSRTTGRGWVGTTENRYRNYGRGNNYFYGSENNSVDGLNELNRGPRGKGKKNQKKNSEDSLEIKEITSESSVTEALEMDNACILPDREQYNKEDFPVDYANAMFFVIKSYSEDDVHKSIKYNVWASTPNGNKKLAAAYEEALQKPEGCPIFLFFSVNASGQFVGVAEMTGPVDFDRNVECWQQDKWTGSFPLQWHIVKDVPNSLLRHITLEYNENKPVTNSRDTQEVKLEQGLKIMKIFKEHSSKTCILDDFSFYEARQKTILEKKANQQQQTHKQVSEEKTTVDERKESAASAESESASTNKEAPPAVATTGDVNVGEDGPVAKPVDDVVGNAS